MASEKPLRDWTERNQGQQPLSDPTSISKSKAPDIASPREGRGPNGSVVGEPGASGNTADGARRGSGSFGGTSSPNAETAGKPRANKPI